MKKTTRPVEQPGKRKKAGGPVARFAAFVRGETVPAPSREEARRRIRSKPGFYASLTPEARAGIAGYDGPEVMGPPPGEGDR